ncbi:MAG: hypothetical protein VXY93_12850, partial [Pseudomonadota bacterium]|nr:hypothetical protein [Pseudomonadota bacterium]
EEEANLGFIMQQEYIMILKNLTLKLLLLLHQEVILLEKEWLSNIMVMLVLEMMLQITCFN